MRIASAMIDPVPSSPEATLTSPSDSQPAVATLERTMTTGPRAVVEHAELTIAPGREAEFEQAFSRGEQAIAKSPGYRWSRLIRQVENPGTYLLLVGWQSLEAHMVEFRGSEL